MFVGFFASRCQYLLENPTAPEMQSRLAAFLFTESDVVVFNRVIKYIGSQYFSIHVLIEI